MAKLGQLGQASHDLWDRTARTAHPGGVSHAGLQGQVSRDRSSRTGQPGQVSQDRSAWTGQPEQDSKDRSVIINNDVRLVKFISPLLYGSNSDQNINTYRHILIAIKLSKTKL
jgi:hypothetical protein